MKLISKSMLSLVLIKGVNGRIVLTVICPDKAETVIICIICYFLFFNTFIIWIMTSISFSSKPLISTVLVLFNPKR